MNQLNLRLYGRVPGQPPQAGVPLPVSWDEALERLETLPSMIVEPDGSFLWSGELWIGDNLADQFVQTDAEQTDSQQPAARTSPATRWQIGGTVFDDGRQVRRVELVGNCSRGEWQRLLSCFGVDWPQISVEELQDNRVVDGDWLRGVSG